MLLVAVLCLFASLNFATKPNPVEIMDLLFANEIDKAVEAMNTLEAEDYYYAPVLARIRGIEVYLDVFDKVDLFIPNEGKWKQKKDFGYSLIAMLNCSASAEVRAMELFESPKNLVSHNYLCGRLQDIIQQRNEQDDLDRCRARCAAEVRFWELILSYDHRKAAQVEGISTMIREMDEKTEVEINVNELQSKLADIEIPQDYYEDDPVILVHRDANLLNNILDAVASCEDGSLEGNFTVHFLDSNGNDEGSVDGGGLKRELLTLAFKELGNRDNGFFTPLPASDNKLWFHPNCLSLLAPDIRERSLERFFAIGRLLGIAIRHRITIPVSFTPAFYKPFSKDLEFTAKDLIMIEPYFRNTFDYITQSIAEASEDLEQFFTDTIYPAESPIVEGVETIRVTSKNIVIFFERQIRYAVFGRFEEISDAIASGIYDVIPQTQINEFTSAELDRILYGPDKIDVTDWKSHTVFYNCDSPSHQAAINWFWEFIEQASEEAKADVLQFSTGSRNQPISGMFRDKPFRIKCTPAEAGTTIRANSCSNQFVLPPFSSREQFLEMLELALVSKEGFANESAIH